MFKKSLIVISMVLSACSTTPVALYSDSSLHASKIATITNSCNAECKKVIKQQLVVSSKYQMSEGLLLEVNGQQGARKVTRGMAFDSPIHGRFTTAVEQGKTELVIDHNSQLIIARPARFTVDLLGGHNYVIGRIRVERIPSAYYEWFPIVYDETAQKIIYGSEDLIDQDE